MKLKKRFKRFLLFIFVLLIVGLVLAYLFLYDKKEVKKVKTLSSIKEYGYTLTDNKSSEYKKLFYKLQDILNEDSVDEEKYVKTISKMFILDFYSLENKVAKTDVGGIDFVNSDALENFLDKAQDTLYKYVESNMYDNREQDLPMVSKVEVESVEKVPFVYGDNSDTDAYKVAVKWEYKDTTIAEGYQDSATLVFVHVDKKLTLVEIQ